MKFIHYKGYIGVDVIILTVGKIKGNTFFVSIIRETLKRTNLSERKNGKHVNIEVDYRTQVIVNTI